jgi:hypothetical protein
VVRSHRVPGLMLEALGAGIALHYLSRVYCINANTPASASQMQIVLNWFEELKQRTAVK